MYIYLRERLAASYDVTWRDPDDFFSRHHLDPGWRVVLHEAVQDVDVFRIVNLKKKLRKQNKERIFKNTRASTK